MAKQSLPKNSSTEKSNCRVPMPRSFEPSLPCLFDGCDKPSESRGLCDTHYNRIRRQGRLAEYPKLLPDNLACTVPGCAEKFAARGMCSTHYTRWWKHGTLETDKPINKGVGETVEERFWSRVDKNGPMHPVLGTRCWIWVAGKIGSGYGQMKIDGRTWLTHQLAYFLAHGVEAANLVLHKCDNPPCCNDGHLYDGTNQDNARDMFSRGRHPNNGYKCVDYTEAK